MILILKIFLFSIKIPFIINFSKNESLRLKVRYNTLTVKIIPNSLLFNGYLQSASFRKA